jgi:hypothetical protein
MIMLTRILLLISILTAAFDNGFAQNDVAADKAGQKDKIEKADTQDRNASAEDKKLDDKVKELYRRLDVGVKIYMDWYSVWGHDDGFFTGGRGTFDRVARYENGTPYSATLTASSPTNASAKNNNAFRIQRAYLDVKYKISDSLSARLTSDADAKVTPSQGDSNAALHLFLKCAYLEMKRQLGPVGITITGGLSGTPVIDHIDKISDYRWINLNYINNSKIILNGTSLDTSADLGLKATISILKYASLTASYGNGSGYTSNETNSHKAVTYLASITPVEGLYFNAFGRNEIATKYDYTGKKAKREYYGYGIGYSSDLIKIGFNQIFPYVTTVGLAYRQGSFTVYAYPVQKMGHMLFDAWLNMNLGAVAKEFPLLITGRLAYGLQKRTYQKSITDSELGKERRSVAYSMGLGWQFNKNFRILLGGELQKYFVSKERVLRYAEGIRGTEYYNGEALGFGDVFVGSKNPRDTKRLYVKCETAF